MTHSEGPMFLNVKNISPEARAAILALYREAKGQPTGSPMVVTQRQLETAQQVLAGGLTAQPGRFMSSMSYAFAKLVLKWFSESPAYRRAFGTYIKALAASDTVRITNMTDKEITCKCGRTLSTKSGFNAHVRLSVAKNEHGIANAHLMSA